jgi:hypothetical protein
LLREYQAGEVDLTEARSRVETALKLVEAVRADDPAAANAFNRKDIRARLAEAPDDETDKERVRRARKLLDIVALDTCLERWFRNPKQAREGDQPEMSPSNS